MGSTSNRAVGADGSRPGESIARAPRRLPGSPILQVVGAGAALAVAVALGVGPPSTDALQAGIGLSLRTGELALALQSALPDRVLDARRSVDSQFEALATLHVAQTKSVERTRRGIRGVIGADKDTSWGILLSAPRAVAEKSNAFERRLPLSSQSARWRNSRDPVRPPS